MVGMVAMAVEVALKLSQPSSIVSPGDEAGASSPPPCGLARGRSCCSASFAGRGAGPDAPQGGAERPHPRVGRALDPDAALRGVSTQSHVVVVDEINCP